jgi:hypothetical protein
MHATNATLAWHDHKEWINWPMRHIEKWDDGWYICMLGEDEGSNHDEVQATCHKEPSTTNAKSSRSTNRAHIFGKCQLLRNGMQGLVYKFMLASLQWSIQAK